MSVVRRLVLFVSGLLVLGITVPARADSAVLYTTRVSVAIGLGVGGGANPQISDDADTIVFESSADDLVAGDTNGASDVFAYSVGTGSVTRASVTSDGGQADAGSWDPAISADGTTIVFVSSATNLDPAPVGVAGDLYLRDTTTGDTTRITVAWDGGAIDGWVGEPQMSDDGSTVVFSSLATNLIADDTNSVSDVFAYDVASGVTTRVSLSATGGDANGSSSHPVVSADGTTIVYESTATNLVADDTNSVSDVFSYDTGTGTTSLVSLTSLGEQSDDDSVHPGITPDGTAIVYASRATNLTDVSTQPGYDIYVRDVAAGTVALVSIASDGTPGDGPSRNPRMSTDGSTVVYESDAANLVAGDTNTTTDVFAHDIPSGTTTRVSVAGDGTESDAASRQPAVARDGTRVVYGSDATTLVTDDNNGLPDIFLTRIINRSPVVSDATLTVPEDAQIADTVGYVPAVDPDGDDLMYTISGGDNEVFAVDNHGKVTTKTLLDFETQNSYSLTVDVTDGDLTEASSLFIEVTDVNEEPQVSDFETSVAENSPVGTVVDTVGASDPDGDPLSFAIKTDPDGLFTVDASSGEITAGGVFDYELDTEHTLTVTVSDGELEAEARVVVVVEDVNETPSVTGFVAQTPETAPPGTVVGTIATEDPEDDVITFEISAGNTGGMFAVDDTGNVTVTGQLDYETSPSHTLTVTGSDGELSDAAAVTIVVTDVYEVDPAFDPFDDDGYFEADIEWLAYQEITRGCAPRLFCPDDAVTREQMAAFLVRALELPAATKDYFSDDEDSIFEDHINRLAAAGITRGCNPAEGNTRFCPEVPLTRGEMAAFLERALGYTDDGGGDRFTDDDGSIFEMAIDKLGAAGVTRGCNPPANDHYCPGDLVNRGQMAAFLHRALG